MTIQPQPSQRPPRDSHYFLSDMHVGASYMSLAQSHDQQRRICRFLRREEPRMRTLWLLGDVLDYWYEYRTVVPRGYTRLLGTLSWLADRGVEIHWFTGNHDVWLFDYLATEVGLTVHDGPQTAVLDGRRLYMAHGDRTGGGIPWGFRFIQRTFRNRVCQRLYAAIHPRWTIPFAHGWSRQSRGDHYQPTAESIRGQLRRLRRFCEEYLQHRPPSDPSVDYFVFGHVHAAEEQTVGADSRMVVLGDWISLDTYAVLRPDEPLRLMRCQADGQDQPVRDTLY